MWAKDIPSPIETGELPGNNIYGTHPFLMYPYSSTNWIGVYANLA